MTPFTLLYTAPGGDIDLSQGLRFTPDLKTYVAQRLDENMSFFLGEWFLDKRKGLPYFEAIIGRKPDRPLLDSLYRQAARLTTGVASVASMVIDFDRRARRASVKFAIRLKDGTQITEAEIGQAFIVKY
jgi:hypothetical protein